MNDTQDNKWDKLLHIKTMGSRQTQVDPKYLIAILENLYISPEEFFKEIKELKIK